MKIVIDIPDITLTVKALNNAVAAFGEACWTASMNCDLPSQLQELGNLNLEELKSRFMAAKHILEQLEYFERNGYEWVNTNGSKQYKNN